MAVAKPIPRKYLTLLTESQDVLRLIAAMANRLVGELRDKEGVGFESESSLREIEIKAYQTALNLSEIEVAGSCESCPLGPPVSESDAALAVLANSLEQVTHYAKRHVKQGGVPAAQQPSA